MNKAKSLFITIHLVLLNLALLHIATLSWIKPLTSAWLGVFMIALPNFYFFVWLFLGRKARTSRHLHFLIAIGLMGFALVMQDPALETSLQPLVWAVVLLLSSLAYIFWYSKLDRPEAPVLAEGQKLPPFELKNLQGQLVKSSHFANKPWILMFYRGNWCPLCMAQIRELAGEYIELQRRGLNVALISNQPELKTQALAKKFEVPFEFFVDEGLMASKKLGLASLDGTPAGLQLLGYPSDTVLPTVVMTNKHGRIIYSDLTDNYRIRPEPEQFLEVARQKLDAIEA